MAKVIKCDRCGRVIQPSKAVTFQVNEGKMYGRMGSSSLMWFGIRDLCPDCLSSLEDWWRRGEHGG